MSKRDFAARINVFFFFTEGGERALLEVIVVYDDDALYLFKINIYAECKNISSASGVHCICSGVLIYRLFQ